MVERIPFIAPPGKELILLSNSYLVPIRFHDLFMSVISQHMYKSARSKGVPTNCRLFRIQFSQIRDLRYALVKINPTKGLASLFSRPDPKTRPSDLFGHGSWELRAFLPLLPLNLLRTLMMGALTLPVYQKVPYVFRQFASRVPVNELMAVPWLPLYTISLVGFPGRCLILVDVITFRKGLHLIFSTNVSCICSPLSANMPVSENAVIKYV
ncbi:uncharacterized protein BDZ83DRAFT_622137 [Colletotrichum acutatum]|uniref:Uncharacterized protein n=1 Tax=Glomerella acutata TaxID=27357 RepID=A0AAD8XH61_GLOAC|nr:uncharacterized protein BDZ83DRAFT_622137 [Colletotrichum acutatum]KAK1724663.1 hypothetical protein BDZ83DRAFT_622137 [Colletotrichum acutatum]